MTNDELIKLEIEIDALDYDQHGHAEPWRNELAQDLNNILGTALFHCSVTDRDDADEIVFPASALRVCRRVAEAEKINEVRE